MMTFMLCLIALAFTPLSFYFPGRLILANEMQISCVSEACKHYSKGSCDICSIYFTAFRKCWPRLKEGNAHKGFKKVLETMTHLVSRPSTAIQSLKGGPLMGRNSQNKDASKQPPNSTLGAALSNLELWIPAARVPSCSATAPTPRAVAPPCLALCTLSRTSELETFTRQPIRCVGRLPGHGCASDSV